MAQAPTPYINQSLIEVTLLQRYKSLESLMVQGLVRKYPKTMRKKSKRTIRPVAQPLSAKQKARIFIGPRLHFQMLLAQQYNISYISSVAGIFNFAAVIAYMKDRMDLLATFDAAQDLILVLIEESRPPSETEIPSLTEAFNLADSWIEMQNTATLSKALLSSGRELKKEIAEKQVAVETANSSYSAPCINDG